MEILGRAAAPAAHVDGREQPAVDRHEVRREGRQHLTPGGLGELLIELGRVAMIAHRISVDTLGHFGEQHLFLQGPPRSGHARLGVDDDLAGLDRLGLEQRDQRQLGAGGVTARDRDQPGLADLAPIDFDQTIDRVGLQLGGEMLMTIPARVSRRIGEAKIGGEIGDLGPRGGGEEFLDHLLGGPVRQPAEGEVESGARPVDIVYRDELGQRAMRELREYCADLLPGLAIGGEQRDLDPRMGDEQPQQLRAGIARSAEHADLCLPRHRSVPSLAAIRTMRTAGILRRREPPQKARPRNF